MDKKSGEMVALKQLMTISKSSKYLSQLIEREIVPLTMIYHPNIIKLVGYNLNARYKKEIVILLEYAPCGDLSNLLNACDHLDKNIAFVFFEQIVSGISACHERGIVHRDLKLSNIMLTNKFEIKIVDFGISKLLTNNMVIENGVECIGTSGYMPPELFVNLSIYKQYDPHIILKSHDVFSVGIIFWKMLNGAGKKAYPFEMFDKQKKPSTGTIIEFKKEYPNYSVLMNNKNNHNNNNNNNNNSTSTSIEFWKLHDKCEMIINHDKQIQNDLKLLFENMFEFDPMHRIVMNKIIIKDMHGKKKQDKHEFIKTVNEIYSNSKQYQENIKIDSDDTRIKQDGVAQIQTFNSNREFASNFLVESSAESIHIPNDYMKQILDQMEKHDTNKQDEEPRGYSLSFLT